MRVDDVLDEGDEVAALAVPGVQRIQQVHELPGIVSVAAHLLKHRQEPLERHRSDCFAGTLTLIDTSVEQQRRPVQRQPDRLMVLRPKPQTMSPVIKPSPAQQTSLWPWCPVASVQT